MPGQLVTSLPHHDDVGWCHEEPQSHPSVLSTSHSKSGRRTFLEDLASRLEIDRIRISLTVDF